MEQVIIQVFQFADGSRIKVIVEVPAEVENDTATTLYYEYLADIINDLEAMQETIS